tara:strand:+ start:6804 stop:7055 length:252 start_codon:yes stop_codon:yes gene_type:complete
MPTYLVPPSLPSSSFNPVYLQEKLAAYVEVRSQISDKSLPYLKALVDQIITDLTVTNNLINSSSAVINQHTHQPVPPAHTFTP